MNRYAIAGILILLHVSASAWLVQRQGEAYRRGLAESRALASENVPSESAIDTAPDPRPEEPPLAKTETPRPTPAPEPVVAPAATPPPEPPKAVATAPAPAPAAEVKPDPIWETGTARKVWDLEKLDVQGEKELGRALFDVITRFEKPIDDTELHDRINSVKGPLLAKCKRKYVHYTFTILDSDRQNAFSHPGGYIYLTRGLLQEGIPKGEDYRLEFVLGHEIAHVDIQHSLANACDPQVKELAKGQGTVALFYNLLIPAGYKDDQDFEADRWAVERMLELNRSHYEIRQFLKRFRIYAQEHGFAAGRQPVRFEPTVSHTEYHYSSHPAVKDRLERIDNLLDSKSR